jgi:transposase
MARILEPHVGRVIVVSPSDTGIRQARAKTDRLDARALARLLWAGHLDGVWSPDERIRAMRRRLARRSQLVRARARAKNEVHAVLMRCLKDRPPASDLFGVKGRAVVGRAAAGGLRARDRRLGRAPGRVPRQRDRRGPEADRRRGAGVLQVLRITGVDAALALHPTRAAALNRTPVPDWHDRAARHRTLVRDANERISTKS